ncbi:MAG: DNA double-strand break repair nuclease NurA [Anaerolineae bacterium]|jgi:hypothetical protein
MTLEFSKVTVQIEDMGRVLAERARNQRRALPAARELLHLFADRQDELGQIAASEAGRRLRCASPGAEALDITRPARPLPPRATLVAADGSQIFPDRHGLAFYYVINIGSIVFRHGSGQAPTTAANPRLFYTDAQLYPGGNPVSGDVVSIERDLAEMRALADLTLAEPSDGPPRVALGDGPLLIWLRRAGLSDAQQARVLDDYLSCLDRLRAEGGTVAGFVSRPHSAEVVALLYLAHLKPEERESLQSLADTAYRGLTDRALFGNLESGARSALFVRGAADNREFQARGHAVYFFYINTGSDLARVEVPEWVAHRPERLDLVQAAVYDQCQAGNGYPYVLTRADELAVILGEERDLLEGMIGRAMTQHGLDLPELSRKAQQKKIARWRRR